MSGVSFLFGGSTSRGLRLEGSRGNDVLTGGARNDDLEGGRGDDILDGGAGSDEVDGEEGNDTLVYRAAENVGARDDYDGGSGTDTLLLEFTRAEWMRADVQADIARYAAHLAAGRSGCDFTFSAFGLEVEEIERLRIKVDGVEINPADEAVDARDDVFSATENGAAISGSVISNDVAPDLIRSIELVSGPAKGSFRFDAATGGFTFDPGSAFEHLGAGQSETVTFRYRITDADGDQDTATASITVAGSNDGPVFVAPELVTNGGFSAGGAGWTNAAGFVETGAGSTYGVSTPGNGNVLELDADGGAAIDTVSQAIATEAGRIYTFSFDSAQRAGTAAASNTFEVLWNGVVIDRVTPGSTTLTGRSYTVTATGATSSIAFRELAGSDSVGGIIDNVSVRSAPANATGAVTELGVPAGALTAAGALAFADADLADMHSVATAAIGTTLGTLTATRTADTIGTGTGGVLTWSYGVAASAVEFLAAGQTRVESFVITLSDGKGGTATKQVDITITGTNDAPVVAGAVTGLATEDGAKATLSALANASDVDAGTVLSVTGVPANLPAGVSYDPATQRFTLDPAHAAYQSLAAGRQTIVSVSYGVSDGTVTTPASVSWTVTGLDDAAVIGALPVSIVTEDVAVNTHWGTVEASGRLSVSDVDQGQASFRPAVYEYGDVPGTLGRFWIQADGTYTYAVLNSAVQFLGAGQTRTDNFTVTALDGTTKQVSFTITGTNDAPVLAGPVTGMATEDGAKVTLAALANASDVDAGAVLQVVGVPSNLPAGVSYDAATQRFTLDPADAAYQSLAAGTSTVVSIAYLVSDGTATAPASVSWIVAGTNDAAVIGTPTVVSGREDLDVSSNGFGYIDLKGTIAIDDADQGEAFFASHAGAADNLGSLGLQPDGSYTYAVLNSAVQYLAAGESRTDRFTVVARDGTSKDLAFTITGTNDAPVITMADTSGSVTEDAATPSLTAAGAIRFDDVDLTDGHILSVTPAPGNVLGGTLAALLSDPATGAGDGAVSWTYTLPNASAQFLSRDETRTETFTVTIDDGQGGTVTQAVTVTVTGTNDGPSFSTPGGTANLTERTDSGSSVPRYVQGALPFTDVDLGDSHVEGLSPANIVWSGGALSPTTAASLAAALDQAFSLSLADSTDTGNGAVGWSLAVLESTFDFLGQSETLTLTYAVSVTDEAGASATVPVVIRVTGTNDRPFVTAIDVTGAVVEDESSPLLTEGGALSFSDIDDADIVTSSVALTTIATTGPAVASALRAALADAVTLAQSGGNDGTVGWSFALADGLVQYLAAGETVTATYTITVADDSGTASAARSQAVTVTIVGTNDRPEITAVDVSGSVTEGSGAVTLTESGSVTFADADETDVLTSSVALSATATTGPVLSTALEAALAAAVTLSQTGGNHGSIGWSFALDNGLVEDLAADETVTATYTITLTDRSGATTAREVIVTLTGTNDAPIAVADDGDGIVEAGLNPGNTPFAGNPTATGNVLANDTDVDAGDTRTVTTTGSFAGTYGTLELGADGAYTYRLNDSDPDTAALPQGTTVTEVFAYTVADSVGATATANLTLSIAGTNDAPVARADALVAETTENAPLTISSASLLANDGDIDAGARLTIVAASAADAGASVGVVGGDLVFDPGTAFDDLAAGETADAVVSYVVSDEHGATATATATIRVTGTNDIASITGNAAGSLVEDGAGSVQGVLTVQDADRNQARVGGVVATPVAQQPPANPPANPPAAPAPAAPAPAAPAPAAAAPAAEPAPASAPAPAPAAEPAPAPAAPAFTAVGTYGTFSILPSGAWTYALADGQPNVQALAAGQVVTDSFTVRSFDGTGTTDVVVTITGTNDAPVVSAAGTSVAENTAGALVATVAVSDVDTASGLTIRVLDGAAVDARFVIVAAAGTVSGRPGTYEVRLAAGQSLDFEAENADGNPTIFRTIEVNDGQIASNLASAGFTITVTDVPEAPTALDDTRVTLEDAAVTFTVAALTANDVNPPGAQPLAVTGVSGAVNGTVTLANGIVTFTPAANFSGQARFDYTIANGAGTDTGTVAIDVAPVADALVLTVPTVSDAVPLSGDVVVNTYTTSQQRFPSIAAVGTGYVVTWSSNGQDGNGFGVYAQRYAADGTRLGGEVRVNTYTTSGQQYSSVAAIEGGYVVTWSSNGQDGSGFGIYAQRYASDGTRLGGEVGVNVTTTNQQQNSAVAATAGGYVVTWSSVNQDGSGSGIYARRYASDGTALGSETRVNTTTALDQLWSSVAGVAGGYVVTWSSNGQDGSGYGIYAQRYAGDGTVLGAETRVNTTTTSNQQYSSVAAIEGGYVVTWSSLNQDGSSYGIYAQRYASNGTALGGETRINTTTANQQIYSSVAATAGGYVVTWSSDGQDGSGFGTYAQRYASDGTPLGTEFRVNADAAGSQFRDGSVGGGYGLAVTADGTLVSVWEQDNGSGEIEHRRFELPTGARGNEDSTIAIPLAAALTEFDGSERLAALTLSGVPAGTTISDGTNGAVSTGAAVDVTGWNLAGLTFTAAPNASGVFTLTLSATVADMATLSTGAATDTRSVTKDFTVTVAAVNDAPVVAGATGGSVAENLAGALVATFTATDVDATSGLAFRVLDGAAVDPRFVVVPAAGTIAGQPGSYEVRLATGQSFDFEVENADGAPTILRTIEVNDGQAANNLASASFTVTVTDVPEPPTAVDDGIVTMKDRPVTITVAALTGNDVNPPGHQPLTITGVSGAVNGTVTLGNGVITFTPNGGFSGEARFDYTLDNGAGSDTGTVSVTVKPSNAAPVVNAADEVVTAAISELANTSSSGTLDQATGLIRFTDADTVDRPSASIGAQAVTAFLANGTTPLALTSAQQTLLMAAFTLAPVTGNTNDGAIRWTYAIADRELDFLPQGATARIVSEVIISDGFGGTDTSRVTVTATGTNDAPVAVSDTATVAEDGSVLIDVLANDTDRDNATLALNSFLSATNGTAVVESGKIRFTPNADFTGAATITYFASDGMRSSNTGSVAVTVTPVNDAPTLSLGGAAGNSVLVNGSFETPDPNNAQRLTGWTNAGSNGLFEIGGPGSFGAQPADGTRFIELDAGNFGVADTITQNVATVAGREYRFSFETALREGTAAATNSFEVLWNGKVIATVTPNTVNPTSTGWDRYGFTVTATGTSSTLGFREIVNDGLGGLIDNVALRPLDPTIRTNEDIPVPVSFTVGDIDAGASPLSVTLTAQQGALSVTDTTGLSVTGQGSAAMTITGTASAINAVALGSAVVYTPAADASGTFTIGIAVSDQGATGAGGALTTTRAIPVVVAPVDDAAAASVSASEAGADGMALASARSFDGATETEDGGRSIAGTDAADILSGTDGADILVGGLGGDILTGRAGADVFVFGRLADSAPGAADRLTDFDAASDRIDLSGIDAVSGGADDSFVFVGLIAGPQAAGTVGWFEQDGKTIVAAETTGDSVPDLVIALDGTALGLTVHDFLL